MKKNIWYSEVCCVGVLYFCESIYGCVGGSVCGIVFIAFIEINTQKHTNSQKKNTHTPVGSHSTEVAMKCSPWFMILISPVSTNSNTPFMLGEQSGGGGLVMVCGDGECDSEWVRWL